jgi:CubicO group peptidase (beta-lactamase class C family)
VAGTPGISLGVSYHGEPIHRASYGFRDLEAQEPINGSTQFPIGTMAKTFTSAAVGSLVAEGKLKWDTPIKSIIPELQTMNQTVTDNLTIVDLLSQRSGLGRSNLWWQGSNATLLLEKKDLIRFYNTLPPAGQFRGDWGYSNWGYALAGEVIERVSGKTYAQYLKAKVYEPLGLKNTTVEPIDSSAANLARPYAAMDDASMHLMPQPPVNGDTIMAPAMGGTSSADDLLAYNIALLRAFRHETGAEKTNTPPVIKHALMHLSGHIFTAKAALEKSYAFGWYRTQLPNTVLGMGWNSIYVKKMPEIVPRDHIGPLLAHGGSLPGYHVAMALLPQINSSIVVCTNSIALGDVSGWVSMALIEALVAVPKPSNFVALATEAASNAALSVKNFQKKLDETKWAGTKPRANDKYVGRYSDEKRKWFVDVRTKGADGLEVVFQGLESQAWALSHYEHDTFLWLASREEQAKRGRMVTYPLVPAHFKLSFQAGRGGTIDRLLWAHEAGVPADQQYLIKENWMELTSSL